MQYEYYYSELSIVEKRIYRLLYDAIKEYKQKISFGYVLNLCLDRIIRAVEYDHPELYYWNCHKVQYVSSTVQITVLLKYYLTYAEVIFSCGCTNLKGNEYVLIGMVITLGEFKIGYVNKRFY